VLSQKNKREGLCEISGTNNRFVILVRMSVYIVGSTFQRHDTRYLRQLSVHNITSLGRRHHLLPTYSLTKVALEWDARTCDR